MNKPTIKNTPNPTSSGPGEGKHDLIDRRMAIDTIMGQPPEPHYPSWYAAQIEILPSAQPATNCSEIPNSSDDTISRKAAIDALARMMPRSYTPDGSHPADEEIFRAQEIFADCIEALEILPSAQPEIIRCKDCIYYDPPHVENNGVCYEYTEMPVDAFDVLGTGLVSMEYGINIGGRCCVDYFCKSYSDDKRVYVPENNFCGRAERRTDETD